MTISSVRIRNFRGIRDLSLDLDDVTVLIGENNSGKTSILDALKLCLRDLGPRRRPVFDALDFHLPDDQTDPSTADPIQIDVRFSEQENGQWGDELTGRLDRSGILQVDADDRCHVHLKVTCTYDFQDKDYKQDWCFLDLNEDRLPNAGSSALTLLQREVSYFYLTALRDAAHHFDARGPFWAPFLRDSQLSDHKKAEIERKLREVNDLVVESHTSFDQVQQGLRRVQEVVALAANDAVSIEAVPGRMFDMLAKAQVHLGTTTGAKIPIGRHGEGTQSLAVLTLFSAFLQSQSDGTPILALEEPEAHLHPSAIRALWQLVSGISGQKLISTHSGDLIAEVDVQNVRRLARTPDGLRSFRVSAGLLNDAEVRKFNYHVRHARGELLFARCWLLVEGETEVWVYSAAARALSINLHREGVRIVEYRQSDVGMLVKIADALGIAWYCVGDDDAQRALTERRLRSVHQQGHNKSQWVFPYRDIETHLLGNGYDSVYDKHMPKENSDRIASQRTDPDYWQEYAKQLPPRAKTNAATEVAIKMEARGESGVSQAIRGVVQEVVRLAGGGS